jgi:hypothetical protein
MTDQKQLSVHETVQRAAEAVSHTGGVRPFGEYVVEGTKSWSSHVVSVERLVFKSGAKLVFDGAVVRRSPNVFVFARETVSEDQRKIGEFGWEAPPPSEQPAPGNGRAGANNGQHTDTPGGPGETGPVGIAGEDGMDAPHLTILTQSISGGLKVALVGEEGGGGGTGGAGGQGGRVRPASQTAFYCRRGAGRSAEGGRGSDGGPGGSGGDGGPGGPGGPGGQEARPWCRGNGPNGRGGEAGKSGKAGTKGSPGNWGTYYVGGLKASDLERILQ